MFLFGSRSWGAGAEVGSALTVVAEMTGAAGREGGGRTRPNPTGGLTSEFFGGRRGAISVCTKGEERRKIRRDQIWLEHLFDQLHWLVNLVHFSMLIYKI